MRVINISIILVILVYAMMADVILADGIGVCASDDDQLACLKKNFQKLYEHDNAKFWKILKEARDKAQSCTSQTATVKFLELASLRPRGAEFEEFFNEEIEAMIIQKPDCFLAAMNSSSVEVKRALIDQLHHPLTVEESSIVHVFHNALSVPEYSGLATEFFNYKHNAQK